MRVYRLERNGLGPFSTNDKDIERLMFCAGEVAENCWPRKPFAPKDWFYGCTSITYLKRWFSSFTLAAFIDDLSFTVNVYEVPEFYVHCDIEQATFQLAKSELIETITCSVRVQEIYDTEYIPTTSWSTAIEEAFGVKSD